MPSRLEIPRMGKTIQATGDVVLRAELDLAILTRVRVALDGKPAGPGAPYGHLVVEKQ